MTCSYRGKILTTIFESRHSWVNRKRIVMIFRFYPKITSLSTNFIKKFYYYFSTIDLHELVHGILVLVILKTVHKSILFVYPQNWNSWCHREENRWFFIEDSDTQELRQLIPRVVGTALLITQRAVKHTFGLIITS